MAQLKGPDECIAEGVVVKGHAPAVEMCRKLIQIGIDANRPIYFFRDGEIATKFRTLSWGARDGTHDAEHEREIEMRRNRKRRAAERRREARAATKKAAHSLSGGKPDRRANDSHTVDGEGA
jgi:hypothetical protein